jgi:uncharacterized protein involved in exopolysaccharide biosynthesis
MLQPASDFHNRKSLVDATPSIGGGGQEDYSIDLREIARILRRRLRIIVITTLALMTVAIFISFVVTPLYTATSTVLIDPHRSKVAEPDDKQASSNYLTDDATINSQAMLMQSVAVLQRVVDNLDLRHDQEFGPHPGILDPIKRLFATKRELPSGQSAEDVAKIATLSFLQRRLKVTRGPTTFLIDINVTSESPDKAAKIANAIADSYFYEQVHSKFETQKIAASWFDSQIDELKSKVEASDRAVEEFRAANNLTIAQQGATINDQQLADLNNKLIDAHVQTAEARAKFE